MWAPSHSKCSYFQILPIKMLTILSIIVATMLSMLAVVMSLHKWSMCWSHLVRLGSTILSSNVRNRKVDALRGLQWHYSFISIQPWRPGLAGTRSQSCDRYGSGTLHPGQVLGGSVPLLSPAFRRSHFSRQVPPSAMTREILAAKGGTVGEKDVR